MRPFLSTLCLLIPVAAFGQAFPKQHVDSLTSAALAYHSTYPLVINRDSVLQLIREPRSSAERILLFYNIVENSDWLTPEQTIYYDKRVLDEAQKLGDKVLEACVLSELGYTIAQNGNTARGLKMIFEALEIAEATGDAQAIGAAYNNLGLCYPNNNKQANEYFLKGIEFTRNIESNHYIKSYLLLNLARLYMQEQNKNSALPLLLECYRLAVDKAPETTALPYGLLNLGELAERSDYIPYMRQVMLMPITRRSDDIQFWVALGMSRFYLQEKKVDSAFFYATEMNRLVEKLSLYRQLEAYKLMGDYYRALPQADSALSYVEKYYQVKDSLYGNKAIEEAQALAYSDLQRQKELLAEKAALKNRMAVYFLGAIAIFLTVLAFVFWRSRRKEQRAKVQVQQQKVDLEQAIEKLQDAQAQLIQSEKMASLGELTAGIAHEIQNPLNFVNNFAEVSEELADELKQELGQGHVADAAAVADDIRQNLSKILVHGKRADAIVKGMLQHSRTSTGRKEPTDLNALADEYLRLAYHGLRAKDKSFNASFKAELDPKLPEVDVVPQDIGRVLLNLVNNAFYTVSERQRQGEKDFIPTVTVRTLLAGDYVKVEVADNGLGIPEAIRDKIFQPFFTTKPTGQGTGLGLSLGYDIIKAHGGTLTLDTIANQGTTFIITLPHKPVQ